MTADATPRTLGLTDVTLVVSMESRRDRRSKEYWREITRDGCLWALRWVLVAARRAVRLLVAPDLV